MILNMKRHKSLRFLSHLFLFIFGVVFYCEFLHYYVTISQCDWPHLSDDDPLKAMVVADTHLLGSRNGHWFDKLRREWQMHRAFQTSIHLHKPHVVIFLGDLFDEGKWCSDQEFDYYVNRFKDLFYVPEQIKTIVVPGNHDMGFHYSLSPHLVNRFESAFGISSVSLHSVKEVTFVAINSMAMHGDDCFLCKPARENLTQIYRSLQCTKGLGPCPSPSHAGEKTTGRLVVLQHFPLYRESDADCHDSDSAPPEEKLTHFRVKWECYSREATEEILGLLDPMLVLSGHTHHGCTVNHTYPPDAVLTPLPVKRSDPASAISNEGKDYEDQESNYYDEQKKAAFKTIRGNHFKEEDIRVIPELTVPSFSWRNKKSPTFAMVSLSASSHSITKCHMPREMTVFVLYSLSLLVPLTLIGKKWIVTPLLRCLYSLCVNRRTRRLS